MDRADRYEIMHIKATCFFSIVGILYYLLKVYNMGSITGYVLERESIGIVFFISVIAINYIKYLLVKRRIFASKPCYVIVRFCEVLGFVFALLVFDVDLWVYIISLLLIMITSLSNGAASGLYITTFYSALYLTAYILIRLIGKGSTLQAILDTSQFELNLLLCLVAGIFSVLCGMIYKDNSFTEQQNKRLLKELEEKFDLLAVAQEEIKYHYNKQKEINQKLEDTNSRLSTSIGEFYTLQQISQAISSIFNIKELLKYVNDIIIGVMGVNYSTIVVYEEKTNRLKVHTTNINNPEEMAALSDNINCSILQEILNSGTPLVENFVDPQEYQFTSGREINSLICVPLMTKTRKFGLVLIEQKYNNAFDDENARLLGVISQQVSIAMENAELYQKMQELASIDGLTEVYNRLYFHQRMAGELKSAMDNDYELSVAIFDIDFFKKFNDTFGHLFGDKVIKSIADLVKSSLRSADIIARYGGEEFIILFPRTGIKEAYAKIEVLRHKISTTVIRDELIATSVTASFGISCYPASGTTEMELLRKADQALYEAKTSGRNCVKIAS